ncbi:hypothetical protein C6501_16580 [Candidatus Poribacteria bacterium]|nr:MAG: hypothetical protein C6501_16580 [Candidatus Poribacteria bacterium]
MEQEKFQEHVLKELSDIKGLFIKNEEDHGKLDSKIESVRTEVESVRTEVESVRTELHKSLNTHLRWSIGTMISLTALVFIIAKFLT